MMEIEKDDWVLCTPDSIKNGTGHFPAEADCMKYDYLNSEYYGQFLVTVITGHKIHNRMTTIAYFRLGENKNFWHLSKKEKIEMKNVVAWQPLPDAHVSEYKDFNFEQAIIIEGKHQGEIATLMFEFLEGLYYAVILKQDKGIILKANEIEKIKETN